VQVRTRLFYQMGVDRDATTAEVREDRNGGSGHAVGDNSRKNIDWSEEDHKIAGTFFLLDNTTTMNEIITSYSVTFRMTMSPLTLDLNLKLIRRAREFAESLAASALESLHEYEYIAGPIQVQGIESSMTRKFGTVDFCCMQVHLQPTDPFSTGFCKTTLSQATEGSKATSFCGVVATNITVQGPPSSFVPYILTDAIRPYMQRRDSIYNVVEVDYWDRGLRMATIGWRLHGKQSEIFSIDLFQNAVVGFLNDSQPTTNISSVLIFNQKRNLQEDTLTVKAVVFGQAALYTRDNYTSTLLSTFDEYPDLFLGRLTGEQQYSDTSEAAEVFAVDAPASFVVERANHPTMSPLPAMDLVTTINVKAQPNIFYIVCAMLVVVSLLSSATGFALYQRNQTRSLREKEAVDALPESAQYPV
jgi:hypothetical protein